MPKMTIPATEKIYCWPIHARLHLAGKNQKSEATLAKEMLRILRSAILENRIQPKSATKADLYQLLEHLGNYLYLAT